MTSGSRKHAVARKSGRRKGPGPAAGSSPRPASADAEWDPRFDAEMAADVAELDRSGRVLTRVLFFVFLGVALLMLAVAALTGISTQRKLAREVSTVAQVTALTERKDSQGNSFFYPVVSFEVPESATSDGGRQSVQLAEGSWPPTHRVGDLVTVLYDTSNPLDARIQSPGGTSALWTWTLVTGILGVAFLAATALAWALGRS